MALVSPALNSGPFQYHHPSSIPSATSSPQQQQQAQANLSAAPEAGYVPIEEDPVSQQSSSCSSCSTLLSVGFNQDYGCFACGTDNGFRVYNCDPFKEIFRREFNNGGIRLVEMLFRCNFLAIVGGGSTPRYPPNEVMVWDDHESRCFRELSFRSEIRAVRLRRDWIVVVLEHKIYVYNFDDLKILHQIETIANPKGLCALSPTSNPSVLAVPGLHRGQVRVEHFSSKKTKFVSAHDSDLACFALSLDGRRLATASSKGTLVRVFNTLDGSRLQELRRGADRAEIYSLAFSPKTQWLALSSGKGTVHVFSLRATAGTQDNGSGEAPQVLPGLGAPVAAGNGSRSENPVPGFRMFSFGSGNPGSSLSFMKGVLPKYFSSEWSLAQYRLPEETKCIVAFGPQKNTVIIVGTDGSYYKCAFDPVHGGRWCSKSIQNL